MCGFSRAFYPAFASMMVREKEKEEGKKGMGEKGKEEKKEETKYIYPSRLWRTAILDVPIFSIYAFGS